MIKLTTIIVVIATVAVTLDNVSAANLRRHESDRYLATMEASESGSTEFLFGEGSSDEAIEGGSVDRFLVEDDSSSGDVVGSSEDESGLGSLVEVESSVDGSTVLGSHEASDEVDDESSIDVDGKDSEDGSQDDAEASYQPGTVKHAPIDDSTWASQEFDKSSLTWWK